MCFARFDRCSLMVVFTAFVVVAATPVHGQGATVGMKAPPLNSSTILQAPPNASAKWEALRGKVVVVEFWATWCGPCRKAIPHWNQLVDAFTDKPVQFLSVTDENEAVVAPFLKRTPIHGWIGLDGDGQSSRDLYGIEGIPTTVIVNQEGVVAAVTHPMTLEPKHIQEVLETGKCSLPLPSERTDQSGSNDVSVERVPSIRPVFEVSARRSGPLPAGHGTDCWETDGGSVDVSGKYATVRQAILTLFNTRETLLDCRTVLPDELYDFTVYLPPGATHADREHAAAPMFRTVFGLDIRRAASERQVYVLKVASTNAPGLILSGPNSTGFGSDQPGGLNLSRTDITGLAGFLENRLHEPVVDGTSLTNRYDLRLKWKMSKRESLPYSMDPNVLGLVFEPNPAKEKELSADRQRQLDGIRENFLLLSLRNFPRKIVKTSSCSGRTRQTGSRKVST
jgi:uncharacterized protein (TIGR03435 family)